MFSNQFCFGKEIVGWAKSSSETNEKRKEILAEAAKGLQPIKWQKSFYQSTHRRKSPKNLIEKFQTSNLSSAIKFAIEYGLIIA